MKPAAGKGLGRGLGVLQIALHHDIAAEHDFAHGLAVGRHIGHVVCVHHRHTLLQRVAHALAAVQARLLRQRLIGPLRALCSHRGRAIHLGKAVNMGDVKTDLRHALDHGGRRCSARNHATHLVADVGAHFGRCRYQEVVHDGRGAVVVNPVL